MVNSSGNVHAYANGELDREIVTFRQPDDVPGNRAE